MLKLNTAILRQSHNFMPNTIFYLLSTGFTKMRYSFCYKLNFFIISFLFLSFFIIFVCRGWFRIELLIMYYFSNTKYLISCEQIKIMIFFFLLKTNILILVVIFNEIKNLLYVKFWPFP